MCLVHEHVDVAVLTLMTLTMCTVPVMSTCVDARLGVVVDDYVYCASDVDVC